MRISDWISDVCSSDLRRSVACGAELAEQAGDASDEVFGGKEARLRVALRLPGQVLAAAEADLQKQRRRQRIEQRRRVQPLALGRQRDLERRQRLFERSEERRVGK